MRMPMKVMNLKAPRRRRFSPSLLLGSFVVVCLLYGLSLRVHYAPHGPYPEIAAPVVSREIVQVSDVQVPVWTQAYAGIVETFRAVGSPIDVEVWIGSLVSEGASEYDIRKFSAILAWESGWGKSWLCQNKHQCLGYGEMESGSLGYHYDSFEQFSQEMSRELMASCYRDMTVADMYGPGRWNFADPNWSARVSEIMAYF